VLNCSRILLFGMCNTLSFLLGLDATPITVMEILIQCATRFCLIFSFILVMYHSYNEMEILFIVCKIPGKKKLYSLHTFKRYACLICVQ